MNSKFPVTPLGLVLVAYPAYLMYTDWHSIWYDYHPAFMMAGFLTLSGHSFIAETKKLHYMHAGLQFSSFCCTAFALYVIWSNKDANGWPHLMTWHSWVGIVAMVCMTLQALGAPFGMSPRKTPRERFPNKKGHITFGKVTYLGALVALGIGWYNTHADDYLVFSALLAVVGTVFVVPGGKSLGESAFITKDVYAS